MNECLWCHGEIQRNETRWICKSCCSMGYLEPPDEIALSKLYQEQALQEESAEQAMGGTNEAVAKSLLKSIGWHSDLGHTLEVGAGLGVMTDLLSNEDIDVLVVEPFAQTDFESKGVEKVSDISLIDPNRKFKWIMMVEVLEHLINPVEFISQLGSHLADDGKLFITTPNASGLRARKDGFEWSEVQNPTHLNLFSPSSLELAADSAGFGVIKRIRTPVAYKTHWISNLALGLTQIVGIDGGLRYMLGDWNKP